MKVEITNEMITQPRACIKQWQSLIRAAPKIACRFHEDVMDLRDELAIPETYYDAVARYLDTADVDTRSIDADLIVAFARLGLSYTRLRRREKFFVYGPFSKTKPALPITVPVAMKLMQLTVHPTMFFGYTTPRNENDLFYMVKHVGSRTEISATKRKAIRALFRRYAHLVKDQMKFVRLNEDWCTEGVFSKMSLRDRKLIAKEMVLSGMEFSGVPIEVYAKTREKTIWILQSSEWSDKQKADFLNHELVMTSKSTADGGRHSNSMFPREWWSTEPGFDRNGREISDYQLQESFRGPCFFAGLHYGPLLFPEKVVIDLQGRLNTTGLRNLFCYLYVAKLKVKVRLSELEKEALRGLHPHRVRYWKPEELEAYKNKMEKHLL